MYIEKDVTDNINSETIISHNNLKIRKLMKENFKTLYICYFVMLIYSNFIINNFFKIKFFYFLMTTLKKLSGAAIANNLHRFQLMKLVFVRNPF